MAVSQAREVTHGLVSKVSVMGVPAIATTGLTKRFGSLTAVNDLTFQLQPGDIVGFLGPNGSGKTTTIRMLLGFLTPTAGSCAVLGGSLQRDFALRGRVGYLPGDFRLDSGMTGRDLFAWVERLRNVRSASRAGALCEQLNLDPSRKFGSLSKGNRQKVGIIQALLHDPDVLILDEPTTGLDPLVQRDVLGLLKEAAGRGAAILFSSHVLTEVEHLAQHVVMIRNGHLLRLSTVDELFDSVRHRLRLRFAGQVSATLFDNVVGIASVDVEGNTATVTIDGVVGPALRAATERPDLVRVSDDGDELEDLFIALYDPAAEGERG